MIRTLVNWNGCVELVTWGMFKFKPVRNDTFPGNGLHRCATLFEICFLLARGNDLTFPVFALRPMDEVNIINNVGGLMYI